MVMEGDLTACTTTVSPVSTPLSSSSPNIGVVLNGTVFSLSALTGEVDVKPELGTEKLDSDSSDVDSPAHSLVVCNNGLIVDTARGLVFCTVGDALGGVGPNLPTGGTTVDLNGSGQFLSQSELSSDSSSSSHLFEASSEDVGVTNHGIVGSSINGVLQLGRASPSVSGETITIISKVDSKLQKKKGGWPKGKKRKKTGPLIPPRAPATGYVIYAIERRKQVKNVNPHLSFADITKILGNEWSTMTQQEKIKYLHLAEADKKRYIDELKTYQQSQNYQDFIKKKKLKATEDDTQAIEGLDTSYQETLEDDALFCKVCNQYFSSLHNRKEHMFGRQHLMNMTCEFQKEMQKQQEEQEKVMTEATLSLDFASPHEQPTSGSEHSLDSSYSRPFLAPAPPNLPAECATVDVEGIIAQLMEKNSSRDQELRVLRSSVASAKERHNVFVKRIQQLKVIEEKLDLEVGHMKSIGASLAAQIDGLRMVPMLFGVLNF